MKKILLLIVSLILFIPSVNAKTYYSEYGDYSSYSEDYIVESDEVLAESKTIYHAYESYKELELVEDPKGIIKEDSVVEYTPYFKEEKLDKTRPYEVCNVYTYNPSDGYKYITLANKGNLVNITVEIYNDEELIVSAGVINLGKGEYYVLGIYDNEVFPLSDLVVKVIFSENNTNYNIEIYAAKYNNPYTHNKYLSTLTYNEEENIKVIDNFEDYDELFTSDAIVSYCTPISGRVINLTQLYRNYTVYNMEEVEKTKYLDLYTDTLSDDYLLDLNDYKTLYRYKKRDKVEIKDNYVIDNYSFKLEDVITYSSIPLEDISITSDIDINKNGVYTINYILPFKTVTDRITVDIKENYINLIKTEEKIIEELNKKTEEATYMVDKKNQEIKEIIKETNEEIRILEEEKNSLEIQLASKIEEEHSPSIKEDNHLVQSISIIGIILFLLCSITITNIIKKNKDAE